MSDATFLDLEVPRRSSSFRFDVLDGANTVIGVADVAADSPPTIANNINRSIKRTMSGVDLPASTLAALDPLADRLRPAMVLENGSEYPLGVFLFGNVDRFRTLARLDGEATSMVDLGLYLDQPLEESLGIPPGSNVIQEIEDLLAVLGVTDTSVEASSRTIGAPVAWPAGTRAVEAINALAAMAGMYSPYFDNSGTCVVRSVPDLETAEPDLVYEAGGRIYNETIVESDDLLDAPNRYIVIDNSATEGEIVGVYDIPDVAPHSIVNRNGLVIATVIDEQGLEDTAAAVDRARAAYAQDSSTYLWASFAGAPDPRHDTFDVIQYNGLNWREQSWSLRLREGAPMQHSLRRLYTAT